MPDTEEEHLVSRTTLVTPPPCRFSWSVDGVSPAFFVCASSGPQGVLLSPVFTALGADWRLQLFPNGHAPDVAGHVALFLVLVCPGATLQPDVQLSVGAKRGTLAPHVFSTEVPPPESSATNWGIPRLVSHAELMANCEEHFPDGVLQVTVTLRSRTLHVTNRAVEREEEKPTGTPTVPARREVPVPAGRLGADLSALLESGQGADVTLLCEGTRIKAHSGILCARSPVFQALLAGELAVSLDAVPVPEEIDEPTLRRTLAFVYTDECEPASAEEAQHLLNAADHYGLTRLRAICERKLAESLTIENAALTLTLADQHCASALKDAALRFVAEHGVAVMKTEGWAHLRRATPALSDDVLHTAVTGSPPSEGARAEAN